ncbi:MAG: hypothetical protein J5I53_08825 [Bradyrhizobiaceae bacterium]|nr:hypothetical protein [Bradyrhizobiaceae bacterium]
MPRHLQFLCILLFLTLCVGRIHAQSDVILRGGFGVSAQFPVGLFVSPVALPNPPDRLLFSPAGGGLRPSLMLGADIGLTDPWRVGASILVSSVGMDYTAQERTIIATPNGTTRTATLEHTLQLGLTLAALRPYTRYQLTQNFALELGLPIMVITGSTYTQTMRFIDPANLTFVDGRLEQTTGSGSTPGSPSVAVGLDVGAEWDIPVNERLWITPGLSVGTNLTSWNTGAMMRTIAITPSIGVGYALFQAEPQLISDTSYVRDTVVILSNRVKADSTELLERTVQTTQTDTLISTVITEHYRTYVPKPPSVLRASLRLMFENADGGLSKEATLRVRTVKRTRVVPVLPLVVFDEGRAEIPSRYVQLDKHAARGWTLDLALTGGRHWQYHVMNIAGARLRANRGQSVQLIVYDDGTDEGKQLAQQRVENVRSYLSTTFGLSAQQLKVEARNGQRSQQPWVFIVDTTRRVLAPIQATDTVTESRLPRVRITPEVVSEASVRSWQLVMSQGTKHVDSSKGVGAVPSTLVWDMNESLEPGQAFDAPITIQLSVTDAEGTKAQSDQGLVTLVEKATTSTESTSTRLEVLRWIGADYLHTPDVDIFGTSPKFDRIEVYPSPSRRADFFVVDAPATVHPVGAKVWFRDGLQEPERALFEHAELYITESR